MLSKLDYSKQCPLWEILIENSISSKKLIVMKKGYLISKQEGLFINSNKVSYLKSSESKGSSPLNQKGSQTWKHKDPPHQIWISSIASEVYQKKN